MKKDFQTRWNERYFRTDHPLYSIYKDLCNAGADFDYIEFLCLQLCVGDHVITQERERLRQEKQSGGTEKSELSLSSLPPASLSLPPVPGRIPLEFVTQMFKLRPEDLLQYLDSAPEWYKEDIDYPKLRTLVEEKIAERTGLKANLHKKHEETLKHFRKESPLVGIFMDYAPHPGDWKTKPPDTWGSFLLLAVTEHLHKKSRSKRPPLYLLAARLLRAARGRPFKSSYQERTNAKALVRKLRKSHSEKWKSDLKILEREFSRVRSVMRPAQPS